MKKQPRGRQARAQAESQERGQPAEAARREHDVLDERDQEFHPEELQEFLEADWIDVQADPEFKERLRLKLWDLVRRRYGPDGEKH